MDKIRWPRIGDRAFSSEGPGRVSHVDQPWADVRRRAETFKIAGDMIVASHQVSDFGHGLRDDIFFPIAYLYRQSLELQLKNLIRLGMCAYAFEPPISGKIFRRHELVPLWEAFTQVVAHHCPEENAATIETVGNVIAEFQDADPQGDALRYETDKDDRPHANSKLPKHVCLETLRSTFDGVFNFLDNWEMDLDATLEDLGEAEMMRRQFLGIGWEPDETCDY